MARTKLTAACRNKRSFMRYLLVNDKKWLQSGKPVFPLTVDNLITYINFRAKTSTFRTIQWYIHSLHHDPLHGPLWKKEVFNHPRVLEVLEHLRTRDRMAGVPLCSTKKKPESSVEEAPTPRPSVTETITKEVSRPKALLSQPVNTTYRERSPIIQQEPAMVATTTPQVLEPQSLANSDPNLSYAVQLDIDRLRRRVCLVNDPLPVTWS